MIFLKKNLPYLIIAGVVCLYFYRVIFTGLLPVPTDALVGLYHPWRDYYSIQYPRGVPFRNFLITDPFRQIIPWRKLAIDQWRTGWPGWNPYSFSGTPLDANVQAAAYNPLNVIFFLTDFMTGWSILIIVQQLISGLGMYLFLKQKKYDVSLSIFGSLAWMLSGFMIAWSQWGTIDQIAAWMPVALLAVDLFWEKGRTGLKKLFFPALLFLVSLLSIVTGGHIQISAYAVGFVMFYAAISVMKSPKPVKKTGVGMMLAVAILVLITGIFIFRPLIQDLSLFSRVNTGGLWNTAGWFLPWQNLIQFLVPDFFGNPATMNYWGIWNYGEFIGYIGMLPFIFAVHALFFRPLREHIFWKAGLVGILLFMLPNPLSELPYFLKVPVILSLQPTRMMFLADFILVYLSVWGLKIFLGQKKSTGAFVVTGLLLAGLAIFVFLGIRHPFWNITPADFLVSLNNLKLPGLLFITAALIYAGSRILSGFNSGRYLPLLFILITGFDLIRFGWKFTPFTPKEYFFPTTGIISYLQKQDKPFRIMATDDRIMPPDVNDFYKLESVSGYDPLYFSRYAKFISAMDNVNGAPDSDLKFNRIITPKNLDSPLFNYLNVKYVISFDDLSPDRFSLVMTEGKSKLYMNNGYTPRIYIASGYTINPDETETLKLLSQEKYTAGENIVIEHGPGFAYPPPDSSESVRLTEYRDNEIQMISQTLNERLIYIGNIYSPGWKLYIDTKPAEIIRANYMFSAFAVGPGKHNIRLVYEP